jgi:hypothetical protein
MSEVQLLSFGRLSYHIALLPSARARSAAIPLCRAVYSNRGAPLKCIGVAAGQTPPDTPVCPPTAARRRIRKHYQPRVRIAEPARQSEVRGVESNFGLTWHGTSNKPLLARQRPFRELSRTAATLRWFARHTQHPDRHSRRDGRGLGALSGTRAAQPRTGFRRRCRAVKMDARSGARRACVRDDATYVATVRSRRAPASSARGRYASSRAEGGEKAARNRGAPSCDHSAVFGRRSPRC